MVRLRPYAHALVVACCAACAAPPVDPPQPGQDETAAAAMSDLRRAISAGNAARQRDALLRLRTVRVAAGSRLPTLLQWSDVDLQVTLDFVRTVGELAPYRPAGFDVDPDAVGLFVGGAPGFQVEGRRLRTRCWSDRDASVPDLIAMLGEPDAFRIEFACDVLARRGPAARAALPELARVLDRPDPYVCGLDAEMPLRAVAARTILAIDATGAAVRAARAVLQGAAPPKQPPEVDPRRVAGLLHALGVAEERELAAQHLVRLGPAGCRALLEAGCTVDASPEMRACALRALSASPADASALVRELYLLASALPDTEAESVLELLGQLAPSARDILVVPPAHGVAARRRVDARPDLAARARLRTLLALPDFAPDAALGAAAANGDVDRVGRALDLLTLRAAAARATVPDLMRALHRERWMGRPVSVGPGTSYVPNVTDEMRERIATCILAVADAADPAAAAARAHLKR